MEKEDGTGESCEGPDMKKAEETETQGDCLVKEVKTEVIDVGGETLTIAPQQYIIVSRDDATSTLEPASKYIRLEGEDGQAYVLAVTGVGDVTTLGQLQEKVDTDTVLASAAVSAVKEANSATASTTSTDSSSGTASSTKRSASSSSNSVAAATAADGVNQTWFTTRDDKHAYQKGGHRWKQGQWTNDEIELLQSNINQYCKDQNVPDPREIIFEMTKDERKDFYRTIARGLQRPLFSVYRRVTRMYDQKNHMGKYTPDEIKHLRELRAKHGNDWAAIGLALGRSASSVKDKCRLMKEHCNSGKWYPEEEHRLAKAVYELTGVKPSESITQGLSWAAVAEQVGTRSEKQCRTKWLNYLNWKQQGGADWTRQDDLTLIEKICKLDVTSDTEIDWSELAQDWPSVRSPQWLRGKWWSLKRHIPEYQQLSFAELLECLNALQYQNAKLKNGVRVTRLELPAVGTGEMALHIPAVSLQAGMDSGGEDSEGFQAFEVLQQWTPNSNTAFLIAQPQLTTATAASTTVSVGNGVASAGLSTDHIIVQAMPVAHSQDDVKVQNVQVQLNPQLIIRAGEQETVTGLDQALTIQLPDGLTHTEQDLHVLAEDSSMTGATSLDDVDLATATQLRDHMREQIIDSESSFEVQVVSEAGMTDGVEMEAVVSGGDLVMGCSSVSSPPQFPQSSSNDAEIMNPLSDPILTSNEADLMGNSSDLESEKVHGHGLEVDLQ